MSLEFAKKLIKKFEPEDRKDPTLVLGPIGDFGGENVVFYTSFLFAVNACTVKLINISKFLNFIFVNLSKFMQLSLVFFCTIIKIYFDIINKILLKFI